MVEVSCFSTTTADAINTAKPCRAACDIYNLPICDLTCVCSPHTLYLLRYRPYGKFIGSRANDLATNVSSYWGHLSCKQLL